MTSEQELIRAAANLARANRPDWEVFLRALQGHVDTLKDHCVSSPLEHLQVAQGRAQAARDLLRTLQTAVQTADHIKGR